MAEAVFRSLTASNPLISRIDSAGTGAYHTGAAPDSRTMETLEDNGIENYDHAARIVRASDFDDFDYIFAMDKENLEDLLELRRRATGAKGKEGEVMLFGDFGGRKGEEVVDPYYGARDGFKIAYEQMVRFSRGFIEQAVTKEQ